MIRVSVYGSSAAAARLWQLAVLTAAGAIGATTPADAAVDYFYGQFYSDSYYYRQVVPVQPRPKPRRRSTPVKNEVPQKDTRAKPQGPLIIAISIEKQKLKLYDTNGFFAEAPVSTGMRGHLTPMGVFSVIQKQKYHRSNIYSGAPMPYMQRITWSGVAMHAGVLPGYPASHGCIRMPMPFAIQMWNWTRMGARVIVTPGELAPGSVSHPLLASFKVPPQPTAAIKPESDTPVGHKADRGAAETSAASSDAVVDLKPGAGHNDLATPATEMAAPSTRTADAGGDGRPAQEALTMSDATSRSTLSREEPATGSTPTSTGEAAKPADKVEPAKVEDKAATKADPADATKKPYPAATVTTEAQPAASDAQKDQSRLSEADKAAAAKPEAPKRAGQIAVFISRKDSKLYVRQNFSPLFQVPVTVAPSDRPLGTHVFTAEVDKNDANALHWSVVSLPVSARALRDEADQRVTHRHRFVGTITTEAKPLPVPDSPAEALDRLTIPADTMARINEMLTTGASIIVSDQGINQGETGEGTDFIVRLR